MYLTEIMRLAYIFRIDMECVRRTPCFHKKAGIPSDKDKNLTGFLHKIFQYQACGTSMETDEHRKNSERIVEYSPFKIHLSYGLSMDLEEKRGTLFRWRF